MDSIATHPQDERQARQVKKLVLAACTGTWENDPKQLANFSLATLLADLLQRYPEFEQLNSRLDSIVNNLNKQTEYRRVAKLLIDQLAPLYLTPTLSRTPSPEIAELEPDWTTANLTSFPLGSQLLSPALIEPEIRNPLLLAAVSEAAEPTQPFSYPAASYTAASYIAPEVLQDQPAAAETPICLNPLQLPVDWFDTRWEIMKYANPLSVKILLFSVTHRPYAFSDSDWQQLQGLSLDDLLTSLVSNSFDRLELERQLQETATFLEASGGLTQTTLTTVVPALLQALQPLFQTN
jgi:hypothetical protein